MKLFGVLLVLLVTVVGTANLVWQLLYIPGLQEPLWMRNIAWAATAGVFTLGVVGAVVIARLK